MPIIKAAKKAMRQSEKRRKRNLVWTDKIKELEKTIEKFISKGENEKAKKILPSYYKNIDKASKNNVINKNTAGRKKSRITKIVSSKTKKK